MFEILIGMIQFVNNQSTGGADEKLDKAEAARRKETYGNSENDNSSHDTADQRHTVHQAKNRHP